MNRVGEFSVGRITLGSDRLVALKRRPAPLRRLLPELRRSRDRVPSAFQELIRACARGQSPWPLLLAGAIGCGKTRAALWLADWVVGDCLIYTEETLQDELGAAMDGALVEEQRRRDVRITPHEIWRRWRTCELAILDDFGSRRATTAGYNNLLKALNYREEKPLIVTTNLTVEEVCAIDDRIASRLECGTTVEGFDLEDQR